MNQYLRIGIGPLIPNRHAHQRDLIRVGTFIIIENRRRDGWGVFSYTMRKTGGRETHRRRILRRGRVGSFVFRGSFGRICGGRSSCRRRRRLDLLRSLGSTVSHRCHRSRCECRGSVGDLRWRTVGVVVLIHRLSDDAPGISFRLWRVRSKVNKVWAGGKDLCGGIDVRVPCSNGIIHEEDIEISCPRIRISFQR